MRVLYMWPHDPLSRQIWMIMSEKNLECRNETYQPLDEIDALAAMNPAGTLPILLDEPPTGGEIAVCPVSAIIEYLEEAYPLPALMPSTSAGRAEIRRLLSWFNEKFNQEVNPFLAYEFIEKRLRRKGQPNPEKLRIGRDALSWHMDYINWLAEQRHWLGGDNLSVVDFACAAHLSFLDYCDMVPWKKFPHAKEWYARIKSRPSFRPILQDRIQGLPPARHYDNLDF